MAPTNNIQDLFGVQGLVAVITGGGSGLGLYAARALEANGALVYLVGRRESTLRQAAETAKHGNMRYVVGDVTSKDSLLAVAERVRDEVGYVNLLFANAGVAGPVHGSSMFASVDGSERSIAEFQTACFGPEMDEFTRPLHVNATAVFYTTVAFLDLLAKGNEKRNVPQDSQVLVTSSAAGFSRRVAVSYAYSASKAAVTHLTKMLSTSFVQAGYRIRANVIAPGLFPSEATAKTVDVLEDYARQGEPFEGARKVPTHRCPSGRTGGEEDFAGTVLFMASRAGAYLNGETLLTDGGRLSQLPSVY